MRPTLLTAALAVAPALAYPGMGTPEQNKQVRAAMAAGENFHDKLVRDITKASSNIKQPRQCSKRCEGTDNDDAEDGDEEVDGADGGRDPDENHHLDSLELIGDLIGMPNNKLSSTGFAIKELLTTTGGAPESGEAYRPGELARKGTAACAKDTCCIWKYVADDMVPIFRGNSGRCTNLARAAIRMGFHDAGGWSRTTGPLGGADGSLILAPEEILRSDNRGLEEIVAQTKQWYAQYSRYGVGMADLVQFAANVATVVCPLGPRVRTFIGRKDSSVPSPKGLLPPVDGSADFLIEMFRNKTIEPHGLTALLGAHTTSQQRFVDPSRAGDPQDSTPGVWDILYYQQTLNQVPTPQRVFKFQSDVVLSQHPLIKQEFSLFAAKDNGQSHWNFDYAREYIRLSLLGVNNINTLTECTKSLPPRIRAFSAPDEDLVSKWLQGGIAGETARKIMNGDSLNGGKGILSLVSGLLVYPVTENKRSLHGKAPVGADDLSVGDVAVGVAGEGDEPLAPVGDAPGGEAVAGAELAAPAARDLVGAAGDAVDAGLRGQGRRLDLVAAAGAVEAELDLANRVGGVAGALEAGDGPGGRDGGDGGGGGDGGQEGDEGGG
ncbi:ligninase H2 [Pyricularia oryzae]|nr:ligninase H2 [Pyricularia oryzae]KAI7915536.1 ligninase H2 [Pyricularia oryzae]